jgi:hypothetical protein
MSALENNVVALPQRRERVKLECAPHIFAPVLLQADDYELAYVGHRVQKQFRRGVLALYFVIADYWPKESVVVSRFYQVNYESPTRWRPPKHGALVNEFRSLFPHRRLPRLDRFPLSWLNEQNVVGRVGTVEHDHERNVRDQRSAYSVVRELLRCSS